MTAVVPFPTTKLPAVKVAAPVPPLATGKVPDTSVANATELPPLITPAAEFFTIPAVVNPDKVNPVKVGELANPKPMFVRAAAVLAKVGFGYVPPKSPPAAPVGAVERVVGT